MPTREPIIQEVDPRDLLAVLTYSVDSTRRCPEGCVDRYVPKHCDGWIETERMCDHKWAKLLTAKLEDAYYDEYSDVWKMVEEGQEKPICISLGYKRRNWTMGNGHHRLAVAIAADLPTVLVAFTPGADYMQYELTHSDEY